MLKERVYEIIEVSPPGDLTSRVFVVFIMTLIIASTIAVMFETVESISSRYRSFFVLFDAFSVAIFTIEYILRLWTITASEKYRRPILGRLRYAITPLAIVDLVAILPFYIPAVLIDLRFVRVLRLFRIFRVFKLGRYSESLMTLGRVMRAKSAELAIILFVIAVLLVFSSSLIYYAEHDAQPKAFPNIPASMWWGVVTLTTIGYGDVYPITPLGKIFGAIVAILGIGMFALPAGILASGFSEEIRRKQENI
ncbi:MAG: ion transporter [Firmicutes bacterium]|nr:ion transporter [Bacillota bacterium]